MTIALASITGSRTIESFAGRIESEQQSGGARSTDALAGDIAKQQNLNGKITVLRERGHVVSVAYKPAENERTNFGAFMGAVGLVYSANLTGATQSAIKGSKLDSMWQAWQQGNRVEFPKDIAIPTVSTPPKPTAASPLHAGLAAPRMRPAD